MHDRDAWLDSLARARTVSQKNWSTAFGLSVLLGPLGADRFYAGRLDLGAIKLLTVGGCFIWWVADVVLLWQGRMKDGLGRRIERPR